MEWDGRFTNRPYDGTRREQVGTQAANVVGIMGGVEARMQLENYIRDIPDFPQPGIMFKDITPLLGAPEAFRETVRRMAGQLQGRSLDAIVVVDARGFLFGAAIGYELGLPIVPVRKPGKLPYKTVAVTYTLEYGMDSIEMHTDGVRAGQRVAVVDDVLATGGTLAAACQLVEKAGAAVDILSLVVELSFLEGRQKLQGYEISSVITY